MNDHIWSRRVDAILSTGLWLGREGVKNWALTTEQAIAAASNLSGIGVAILGGDVWIVTNEGLQHAKAGWSCDPRPDEEPKHYVQRSLTEAKRYISLPHWTDRDRFALVPGTDDR